MGTVKRMRDLQGLWFERRHSMPGEMASGAKGGFVLPQRTAKLLLMLPSGSLIGKTFSGSGSHSSSMMYLY